MKKIKYLGLFLLIIFTFIYTDKVISVISNNDDIMLEIKEQAKYYKIDPINAILKDDTIIPGINGKEVDIVGSYNNMKNGKIYNPELLKFRTIYPEYTLKNNFNKYIIQGNNKIKNVSIIYILNNNFDLLVNNINDKFLINIFISYGYLENNINNINKLSNNEIYNYGDNGVYSQENILLGNNIINNKTNNKGIYCLTMNKNINTLNTCSNNKLWTIIPTISGGYLDVKNNIGNGSIILINNISELYNIYNYIISKGYNIVGLSKLLSENID